MAVKFPHVYVQLTGEDGNGFIIVSRVSQALRRAGAKESKIEAFQQDATSGDYSHLLATVQDWVSTG